MGIPYLEYACTPLGELSDLIDLFLAAEGAVEARERKEYDYIPEVM